MEFYISGSDDKFFDKVLDPAELAKVMPAGPSVFDNMKKLQDWTDTHATMKWGHKVAGGSGDIKIIARFPESVLVKILEVEPDFLKDKANFNRVLRKHPIYAAYTRKSTGGAA